MGFVQATRESDAYPYFVPLGNGSEDPVILVANDYLGLRADARIRDAAKAAIDELGTSRCASPLAGGYTKLHQTLERRLAEFLDQQSATLFASGYQANVGIVSALMRPQDLIVTDVFNHASIVDGARLSGAEVRFLRHNSGKHLETILASEAAGRRILVILEGIYSVDGDIVRLPELCRIAHDHGALVMIDEAHSLGVVGAGGRGAAEHFDMLRDVDLVMGTMSKSLASVGGFVAGDEALVDVIRHQARSLIFSASAPPANVAAALAALDVLEKEPERRERLWANTRRVLETLRASGFDTMRSETPVIPILVGEPSKTLEFAARLRDRGVLVCAAVPPMVQAHLSRVRAHVTAAHDEATLGRALATILEVGAALGIPKERVAGVSPAAREDAAIPPIALDARPDRA
jgi:8-amino-7-oxononanoate synthase